MSLKAISLNTKILLFGVLICFIIIIHSHTHTQNDIPCDCHGRKILWISRNCDGITFYVFDTACKSASTWDSI